MTPTRMTPAERLASLYSQYQDQGTRISIAEENGLFAGGSGSRRSEIEKLIPDVEAALKANDPAKTEEELFKLQGVYYSILNGAGVWWRLVHVYGLIHIAGTFVGAYFAARFAEAVFVFKGAPDLTVLYAGIGGAALKGLYTTIDKANREYLRRAWIVSATVGPFVGLLLSVFIHYSFSGGLSVFGKSSGPEAVNQNALIWVCLFAGLKWEWAMAQFESISKKLK